MRNNILKRLAIVLSGLLALLLIFYVFVHFQIQSRIDKEYDVELQTLAIPDDSASYALGRHVAEIRVCMGCHGDDLGGGMAFVTDSTPIGVLYAPNITSGEGGISYTDQDWIRALRHGLGKDNRSLWLMPAQEFYHISNREMGALISYLKEQPPVHRSTPPKSIKPLGRLLTFFDEFPLLVAEKIDHNFNYPEEVQLTVDADYGRYLAVTCTGCHTESFKGAAAFSPEEPPIPDISSTGNVGRWSEAEFISVFRTGKTPEGKVLSKYMPVEQFTYSDDELKALYAYLHQVE